MEPKALYFTVLIVVLIFPLIMGDRLFRLFIVLCALGNIRLYLRSPTITIKLNPHTKCYGINNPQPLSNKVLNNNINDISLPHETNVLIRDGFTFKFVDSDDVITNNIYVNNSDVYTLGPINPCKNSENFSINPKTITVKKETPYYTSIDTKLISYCDNYYYFSLGEIIMLPRGTEYNDGYYNEELSCDTKVIVA